MEPVTIDLVLKIVSNSLDELNFVLKLLFSGMGIIIIYILNELRRKISKDQFQEFKDANSNQHKAMTTTQERQDMKLDKILLNQNKG